MTDNSTAEVTLEAEVPADEAAVDIARAVSGRRAIARKYVKWVRSRNPEATPAEVIQLLERHYTTSITTAGAAISVGSIAADIAIAMIPGVGPAAAGAKSIGAQAAKRTGKEAAKLAAKNLAKSAAKTGAQGAVAKLLPAGDQQLQFEITAVFGLAVADIHGMDLDKDQAQALVYGLTNERVAQQQIAAMASDVASISSDSVVTTGQRIASGREDWSHWASTLSDALPGGAAQSLIRTIQTGELDPVRENLTGKQRATIEYGVGAVTGGVARFVFGRDVVKSSRTAFPEAPESFPDHLTAPLKSDGTDGESESRAFAALEEAAKSTGTWVSDAAGAVGGGVANAAGSISKAFRSVDLDGDGVPDEPQALTSVKNLGGSVVGAADAVGGRVAGLFKRKNKE
ncbi:hypothetical protein [Curtobacterium flaccumfaciens]|uniref:hypothetical protein n=2 Tax=Curtobacterium flaccumfaciens TaxID=2035 RepID=UPI001BDF6456|nr:hypothetical protein [Curtobacterium flaccumfaciens]MBT1607874.1 hypothetical protein [Curtobacterium flaccumfaciens pv. betae]MBT1657852.1 hypothetical protein [Curtobacterium flaccumfaciens pv. betae]MCS0475410.1 hypothetical protein [Curtobacterium flaccumfaciens pv. betae]MCS0483190.1 hypothetical protein [Curtobacterium flaccumfaciens pv. betae]MCS0489091.1 hypothetical protein [Curtobacterium flaccumfaciens pv. betae]